MARSLGSALARDLAAAMAPPAPVAAPSGPVGYVVDVTTRLAVTTLGNRREGWRQRQRRVSREWHTVADALAGHEFPGPPWLVTFVRAGWGRLDPDGLVSAIKTPLDSVAFALGCDDRDPRLHVRCAQSVTRAREFVPGRRGGWRTAARLRVRIEPWRPEHGEDLLRVLRAAPTMEAPHA